MTVLTPRNFLNRPGGLVPAPRVTCRTEPDRPSLRPYLPRLIAWTEDEPGLVLAWRLIWVASWFAVLECVCEWLAG